MAELSDKRIAVLATDGFEESELTETTEALRSAGAQTEVISLKSGQIQAFQHLQPSIKVAVDRTIEDADPADYDAVLLPGGALNADTMRAEPKVKWFLDQMHTTGKPFAVICHAPWELISAGLAEGRKMTGYHTIQDDLRNAGANWVDEEVVVDGNLVSSRQPSDIPAFNREMVKLFARTPVATK